MDAFLILVLPLLFGWIGCLVMDAFKLVRGPWPDET